MSLQPWPRVSRVSIQSEPGWSTLQISPSLPFGPSLPFYHPYSELGMDKSKGPRKTPDGSGTLGLTWWWVDQSSESLSQSVLASSFALAVWMGVSSLTGSQKRSTTWLNWMWCCSPSRSARVCNTSISSTSCTWTSRSGSALGTWRLGAPVPESLLLSHLWELCQHPILASIPCSAIAYFWSLGQAKSLSLSSSICDMWKIGTSLSVLWRSNDTVTFFYKKISKISF